MEMKRVEALSEDVKMSNHEVVVRGLVRNCYGWVEESS